MRHQSIYIFYILLALNFFSAAATAADTQNLQPGRAKPHDFSAASKSAARFTRFQRSGKKPFSVPCAKALRIGLSAVEKLYFKEMERQSKGDTDSDTEITATREALNKYISCRRADNAAKLKTFSVETKAGVKRRETAAGQLARARFEGLIFGVSWSEKDEDPINYQMTRHAVALVEDYRGALIISYSSAAKPVHSVSSAAVKRDEKSIREILIKMENRKFDDAADAEEYRNKFVRFKTSVNRFLRNSSERTDPEKAVETNFVVNLLKLGSY